MKKTKARKPKRRAVKNPHDYEIENFQNAAFKLLAKNGWRVYVTGPTQVVQGDAELNFILQIGFTGVKCPYLESKP
jgi:hypothetical protein